MGIVKRYKNMIRKVYFFALRNGNSRANYLRKINVLYGLGENVYYHSRIFPSDPKLLKIGNNVSIATNVRFLGHDRIDILLSGMYEKEYTKWFDCIEVGNNVFIGSDVVVLPGTKIGNNTIIGAGAVVTGHLPSGKIWGGVPAKPIGEFDYFIKKRMDNTNPENKPDKLWKAFYSRYNE